MITIDWNITTANEPFLSVFYVINTLMSDIIFIILH